MRKLIFAILGVCVAGVAGVILADNEVRPVKTAEDYAYEAYCDSMYENDTDYYLDVIEESEKYQDYIEKHGEWWKEYDTYKNTH